MAAISVHSDFGAQVNSLSLFPFFLIYLLWSDWMDGEVCTMKCDPTFKKKGILLYVTTRMNLESIMPSETSHSQKKYCMVPLTWSIKILKLIDTKKRMVVARDWGRRECRVAVQRLWSFSYARWIISRDLMCDTAPVANNTALGT